jgi:type I restriction enzyme, S subunit
MADEWIKTTIGRQATLQRGIDITRAEQRSGTVPVISSGGVSSYHDTPAVSGPGVILGRKGVVGSVYFVRSDYWPHDTTLWVKDFHGNNRRFVYYFFKWMAPRIATMDVGSANPTLNRNHVHPIEIRWPSLPEQNAIAGILGALDDRIALNRQLNETLEAMARALFKSWFVDFDPVRAKVEGRDPGLPQSITNLFSPHFADSELGEIPDGWKVEVLESVLSELETGGRPKGGVSSYREGVPSIGAESIVGLGIFDYSKTKYVPRDFYDAMSKGHVKNRDVLLYKRLYRVRGRRWWPHRKEDGRLSSVLRGAGGDRGDLARG